MKTTVEISCPFCRSIHTVTVEESAWDAYERGARAQDVFLDLDETERESIISGLCPDCQQELYDSGDAEDYDPAYDLECGFDPYMGEYSFDC